MLREAGALDVQYYDRDAWNWVGYPQKLRSLTLKCSALVPYALSYVWITSKRASKEMVRIGRTDVIRELDDKQTSLSAISAQRINQRIPTILVAEAVQNTINGIQNRKKKE